MKAIQLTGFGGVENFRLSELPDVSPSADQIKVRVRATSVNPLDIQTRRGDYRDQVLLPAIIGNDVSGEVVELGSNVRDWDVGDEVVYFAPIFSGSGAYAEMHAVDARLVVRKPAGLTHVQAASLPLAGTTVWTALHERAGLRDGETVVIHAGAGGVGVLAIQIAKACGARVLTTCRPENNGFVQSLGADEAIDYRKVDWVEGVRQLTQQRGADVIFDTVGGDVLTQGPRALAPGGRIASIVDTAEPQVLLDAWGRNARYDFIFVAPDSVKLGAVCKMVDEGALHPVIDSEFALESVGDAHTHLERGGVRGKVVLRGF